MNGSKVALTYRDVSSTVYQNTRLQIPEDGNTGDTSHNLRVSSTVACN
jgi:hypothetical protein